MVPLGAELVQRFTQENTHDRSISVNLCYNKGSLGHAAHGANRRAFILHLLPAHLTLAVGFPSPCGDVCRR